MSMYEDACDEYYDKFLKDCGSEVSDAPMGHIEDIADLSTDEERIKWVEDNGF